MYYIEEDSDCELEAGPLDLTSLLQRKTVIVSGHLGETDTPAVWYTSFFFNEMSKSTKKPYILAEKKVGVVRLCSCINQNQT